VPERGMGIMPVCIGAASPWNIRAGVACRFPEKRSRVTFSPVHGLYMRAASASLFRSSANPALIRPAAVCRFPMLSNLRLALRNLAKSRGFSVVAILTLAVGIGATTAMFSALRAMVLRPYSYPRADRLVHVWSNDGQPLSTPDYFDILDQATSFADLGVYSPQPANLGGEKAQAVRSVSCTPGVLRAFGVTPALGRWFAPADEEKGAPPVAVLSYALWQQAFSGDPGLVGRRVRIKRRRGYRRRHHARQF